MSFEKDFKKLSQKRKADNQALLMILTELINKTGGNLRFSQILSGYGFVGQKDLGSWKDEFYTEPGDILERVKKEYARIEE